MKVVISGSHGLIGSAVVRALKARGDSVVPLVRSEAKADEVLWDPTAGTIDAAAMEGIDAVVHLAGEGIGDKRWTEAHKARVLDSRVRGTHLLATTIAGLAKKPAVMISGSAIGFYGNHADAAVDESGPNGDDFLAGVVRQWEQSAQPAVEAGIRVAYIRTGLVLSDKGGLLPKMMTPTRFFVGGKLSSGTSQMSWISLTDEVGAILYLLDNDISGPVNLTAPNPVTNDEFAKTLASEMGRPAVFTVPKLALNVLLGKEMAEETALASQRALPKKLLDSGYIFKHPTLEGALVAEIS